MKRFSDAVARSALALTMGLTSALTSFAKEPLTPEHVARLRFVSAAVMSPDGKRIAYVVSVPRKPFVDDDGPAWAELHVAEVNGTTRPFVTGDVNVSNVSWTPDGSAVSFLAKRGKDEQKALYVIAVDGGEARKAVSFKTDISEYSWSPDGSRVAYIAAEKEPEPTKERKDKGFKQEAYEEDWQPVRVWITEPRAGLTAWDKDDSEELEPRKLDLPGVPSELHWSPAGPQIALALAPTPLVDDSYMAQRVHIVDVESGNVLARIDNPGKLGPIEWSPDGQHLALILAEDIHDPAPGRLMIAPTAASNEKTPLKNLLPHYAGAVSAIAWQDNQTVMFLGDEGVWTTFGEVRIDGAGRKTHVPEGNAVMAGLSLSRDGQSASLLCQSPTHPSELFVITHAAPKLRRLTDLNPWLSEIEFGSQEVVTFPAFDGIELEGILIRPLHAGGGGRFPLILTVHGGPESHYSNGWLTSYHTPGQVAAGKDYAVFYPNYRGSTGRGVDFSKLGQNDQAGKEFDDLVDAVEHMIKMGLVDESKVGITGGSYGGFATAWAATFYTKRFAAAVMNVGISDQISKYGTTDIPEEMYLVHSRKRLWEDWEFFLKRSPIYYVEQARTPILIMHGKDDTRVHTSQSLELYRHLNALGKVPVRLVLYPGEGHGNRKAAARYDYNMRMMQWFDHYLKGPGGDPPGYELEYPLKPAKKDKES